MVDSAGLRAGLRCGGRHPRHPEQVVGRPDHVGGKLRLGDADEATASQAADRLHPAEDLFNALSLSLADEVAVVTRGPAIETWSAAAFDGRDVRSDVAIPEPSHEAFVVVALVGTEGAHPAAALAPPIEHRGGSLGLEQRRLGDLHIDKQTAAVL